MLQAHYNSIHSIIKSIPVLTLHSVCFWKRKQKQGRGEEEEEVKLEGVGGCVCHTPDSDLAQSTHPLPIIQNDTVEERLRERGWWRKEWESVKTQLKGFFTFIYLVSLPMHCVHTALESNYIKE